MRRGEPESALENWKFLLSLLLILFMLAGGVGGCIWNMLNRGAP